MKSFLVNEFEGARVRGRTLRGGVVGTFSEPLLRTLLRTLFYCKTHSKPPSKNPSPETSPEPSQNPSKRAFLERCVAVRPLRRAPKIRIHISQKIAENSKCIIRMWMVYFTKANDRDWQNGVRGGCQTVSNRSYKSKECG